MHILLLSRPPLVVDLRYCSEVWVTSSLQRAARWVADRLPPLSEVLKILSLLISEQQLQPCTH